MNKCRFLSQLNSYIDNQLEEKKRSRLEEHLKHCPVCANELGRLQLLSLRLKEWPAPVPDPGFDAAVRDKIVAWELGRDRLKMKKRTIAILVPSGVLAGVLVFLFVGVFGQQRIRGGYDCVRKVKDLSYERKSDSHFVEHGSANRTMNVSGGLLGDEGQTSISYAEKTRLPERVGEFEPNSPAAQYPIEVVSEGSVIVIQPQVTATAQGEKIIRTADLTIEVDNGKEAYKKISEICQGFGGYLASSRFYKDNEGREAGTVTLRIPKEKFEAAIEQLNTLGKVQNIFTDSRDVSQEYSNLKAQLEATMIVYKKMLEALQKRQTTISEAVRLESEITPVLRQVESLKNRIDALENLISYTTVTVNFHEAKVSIKALRESRRILREGMLKTALGAVKFIAAVIPLLVVTALLIGLALLVKPWIMRIFRRG